MFAYYVLDIETTGFSPKKDEMIEVAAIKVVNGRIADSFETFINPGRHIPKRITDLTGISDSDVCDAPDCDTVIMQLARFLSDSYPIVGHNIRFDLSFIGAALHCVGIRPEFRYIDTLTLSQRVFPNLMNYQLDTLISYLRLANHAQMHRAMDDVIVTYNLFLACMKRTAIGESDLIVKYRPPAQKLKSNPAIRQVTAKKISFGRISSSKMRPTVESIDTKNPLYGKVFVFTGELSISREDAAQIVVNCGGIVRGSVSTKTDYLVVGERFDSYKGTTYQESGKEKTTKSLNSEGAGIQVLNELAFFRMVPIAAIPDADGIAIF